MTSKLSDLLERSIWTFAQAFMGSLIAVNVTTGTVNWKEVLLAAVSAGVLAVLKVLGVNSSVAQELVSVVTPTPAKPVTPTPAPTPTPSPSPASSDADSKPLDIVVPAPAPAPDLSDGQNPLTVVTG